MPYLVNNVHDVHYVHSRFVAKSEVEGDGWATSAVREEEIHHLSRVVVGVLPASRR
jgi:hypothetical protein